MGRMEKNSLWQGFQLYMLTLYPLSATPDSSSDARLNPSQLLYNISSDVEQLQDSMQSVMQCMSMFCQKGQVVSSQPVGDSMGDGIGVNTGGTQTDIIAVHTPQMEAGPGMPFPYQRISPSPRPSSLPISQTRPPSCSRNPIESEAPQELKKFATSLVDGVLRTVAEQGGETSPVDSGEVDDSVKKGEDDTDSSRGNGCISVVENGHDGCTVNGNVNNENSALEKESREGTTVADVEKSNASHEISPCVVISTEPPSTPSSPFEQLDSPNNNQRPVEVLHAAKTKKTDVTIVFLDITKAFDSVGHDHIRATLESSPVPTQLTQLVIALQEGNTTRIELGHTKTKPIALKKGVMQGSPLSPALYILATDHILNELYEQTITSTFRFELVPGLPPLTVLSFADDTIIIGKDEVFAIELTRMAYQRFTDIGLNLNPNKSVIINISKGKLVGHNLSIYPDFEIKSIGTNDSIRYLGVNFSDSIVFNPQSTLKDLSNKLETLTSSPFLHADQKYCVLNTSICPSLIYQFQTIPSELIPKKFLDDADKLIKSALKEVLNLPTDIPDAMVYSPRKYKGLGIFRTKWEALLQQINALQCLHESQNPYIIQTRQVHEESIRCAQSLNIVPEDALFHKNEHFLNASKIRNLLRNREFDIWCRHPQKGKGVVLFKQYPSANKWICKHEGLSNSEWHNGIKMVRNVAAVHAVLGRSQDNRCRHCHNEIETLAHVLGSCPHGEDADYNTFEEVHGLSITGSTQRIDIIAFKESTRSGFIIDPTVRFKTNEEQPAEVDKEKKNIYNPTIPYYLQKYQLEELEVIGLLVGARGTATLFMKDVSLCNIRRTVLSDMRKAAACRTADLDGLRAQPISLFGYFLEYEHNIHYHEKKFVKCLWH
ncbi:hypothetical protein ANN_26311 [Periplaneta americana]|uniref:Reverse transcriptase domain-containing protein n=1 Tax=Periplaneta americana TaxID=6978 RepID=A0ABQ8S5W5_PERAM|nr:hypothetical protein ANN_26311 [Periplaneta americana]